MTKLVKQILKKRKFIIATTLIIFLSFLLGAHFHKDELWPFGKGYYADIKDIKKYGFNFKEIKKAETEKKKAETEKKKMMQEGLKSETNNYKIKTYDFHKKYDHIAIVDENFPDNTIELIATDGNKPFVRLSLTIRDNTGMSSESASLIMLEGIGSREQCFLFISRIVLASFSSVTGLNLVNEDVQVIGTGSVVGVGTSSASITEYIFVTLALKNSLNLVASGVASFFDGIVEGIFSFPSKLLTTL